MKSRSFTKYRSFIAGHYDGMAGALTGFTGLVTGHEVLAGRLIRPERFDVRGSKRILDADESNIQPRDEIKIGEQNIEADQIRLQSYDTWKWVALAALVLLVLEWAVYHRRVWF